MYLKTQTEIKLTDYEKDILRKASGIFESMYQDFDIHKVVADGFSVSFFEEMFANTEYILDNLEGIYESEG